MSWHRADIGFGEATRGSVPIHARLCPSYGACPCGPYEICCPGCDTSVNEVLWPDTDPARIECHECRDDAPLCGTCCAREHVRACRNCHGTGQVRGWTQGDVGGWLGEAKECITCDGIGSRTHKEDHQ